MYKMVQTIRDVRECLELGGRRTFGPLKAWATELQRRPGVSS